ncbi:hypothetical protein PRIPAC_82623 [Pristionchus pacificus]|uniref:G protein-coupled receptor n=1 Tax=Pristionchus pacificus TaxID=54126 RepID=A0A2A6C2A0_PRIPA|nr:hypothetical protein PRIPAC_82623 [Pristionchus pacificus]|eukprot:PDM72151.1 G protein-coupled receptor [Pristionchus pacificus]
MSIVMNGIDFILGFIGLSANFLLIIAIIFTKDSHLKAYSLIIFNSALTDFIEVVLELLTMNRMIADFPFLLFIFEGFCTRMGTFACQVALQTELHLMFHSIILIAVSFWYRNSVLSGYHPSFATAQGAICAILVPTLCSTLLFDWSNDSVRMLPHFYPGFNLTEIVRASCNFNNHRNKLVAFWCFSAPSIAYCAIFYFRKQANRKMFEQTKTMSNRTRHMHDSLIRALSYHALLPSVTVLGMIGFVAQNLGLQNPVIERAIFMTCTIPPVLNPFLTLYFNGPYRRTMTILMNCIDFAIGSIGIPANTILIFAIVLSKDTHLKAYSVILLNSAVTDLIAVIVELMAMTRMIADYPALVHIYEGFCTRLGTLACKISMLTELHVMFHSILLIAVAFWYRNTILNGRFPSSYNVQGVICGILVPTIISMCIFTWSNDSYRVVPRVYPGINMTNIVHTSCNFNDRPMTFVQSWTMSASILAYAFIFYYGAQVHRTLREQGSKMSSRTKEMHDSLIRALTYHSLLPSFSILGVFGFAAQMMGVQNPMIERAAFVSCSIPPAINALLTLYFVAPYRRFVCQLGGFKSGHPSLSTVNGVGLSNFSLSRKDAF